MERTPAAVISAMTDTEIVSKRKIYLELDVDPGKWQSFCVTHVGLVLQHCAISNTFTLRRKLEWTFSTIDWIWYSFGVFRNTTYSDYRSDTVLPNRGAVLFEHRRPNKHRHHLATGCILHMSWQLTVITPSSGFIEGEKTQWIKYFHLIQQQQQQSIDCPASHFGLFGYLCVYYYLDWVGLGLWRTYCKLCRQ